MFEKYLQDIGLSDKEAQVYLALLQVDHDSVLDISKKTKINRTTIYPVLESLAKKGLISEIKVDAKVRYQAEPPERLETYVERQKTMFEEQAKRLVDVIPQLKSVQRETGERPVVKMYDGKEGIISSIEDFFNVNSSENKMYMVYPKDLIDEIFTEVDMKRSRGARLNKNIEGESMYTYTKGELDKTNNKGNRFRIDEKKYPILCDIAIYGDKVRVGTLGNSLSGIVINSHDLALTLKSLFKIAFDTLKKEGPNT